MSYHQSTEDAAEIADEAISHMASNDIPATPHNFTVWYEFFGGINADLTKSVTELMESHTPIDTNISGAIFRTHFGSTTTVDEAYSAQRQIEAVAEQLLATLKRTGEGTEQYGEALEGLSGSLSDVNDVGEIRGMITGVLKETKTMSAHMDILQRQVLTSSDEISTLKEELESARRDAMIDTLTGLANRKCFDQALDRAAAKAMDENTPLALIFGDLDHFKDFNDNYGHQVGDQVLRVVGRTLQQRVKGQDTAARYGGEEFAIILPATTVGGASTVAEDIRSSIASKTLKRKGTNTDFGKITMSMGVTVYTPGEPLSDFIARADAALYEAKRAGRNQVMCQQPERASATAEA